jgi:hypothetical protein
MNNNNSTKAYLIRAVKEAWSLLEEDLLNLLAVGMQYTKY